MVSKQKQSAGTRQNQGARNTSASAIMGGSKEPRMVVPVDGGPRTGVVMRKKVSRDELQQDFNSVTIDSGQDRNRSSKNQP